MIKYRVHLRGRLGKLIEIVEFMCRTDDEAAEAVMEHLMSSQTAEVWQGRRLVSRVVENGVVWNSLTAAH